MLSQGLIKALSSLLIILADGLIFLVKKALKLYCLNMAQPILSDLQQTEIKHFIMDNQSVKLKSKYELIRCCILNDKKLACRLFGRLLSMKY